MTIESKDETLSPLNMGPAVDAECRQALEELRWPDGVACLRCGSASISRIRTRRQYDCNDCRHRFSVTTGTVFNDTHLALPKWFIAVFLMCGCKEGVSAHQIRRTLGVAQKTAWYLCHRIRKAMSEVHPQRTRPLRQAVLGVVERDGRRRMSVGLDNRRVTLRPFIRSQVSRKHLDRYLDEFEFREKNRKNPHLFRDTLRKLVQTEAMSYEKLTT